MNRPPVLKHGTRERAPLGLLSVTRQKVTKERAKGTPLGTPTSWIGICALPPQGAAAPLNPQGNGVPNLHLNSYDRRINYVRCLDRHVASLLAMTGTEQIRFYFQLYRLHFFYLHFVLFLLCIDLFALYSRV